MFLHTSVPIARPDLLSSLSSESSSLSSERVKSDVQKLAEIHLASTPPKESKKKNLLSFSFTKILERVSTCFSSSDKIISVILMIFSSSPLKIFGSTLCLLAGISNLVIASRNVNLHKRWIKKIEPSPVTPKPNEKEVRKNFEDLLYGDDSSAISYEGLDDVPKSVVSWEDHKTKLEASGISVDENILGRETFEERLKDPRFKRNIFKQYLVKCTAAQKTKALIEVQKQRFDENVKTKKTEISQLIIEHPDLSELQDKLLAYLTNKPVLSDGEEKRKLLCEAGIPSDADAFETFIGNFTHSLGDKKNDFGAEDGSLTAAIVARARQEESWASVNNSLEATVGKIHSLHRKFLVVDLALAGVTFAVSGLANVTKIALQIAALAGGITAPLGLAVTLPLAIIPTAVKFAGKGLRFAFFRHHRKNYNNAQLSGGTLNLSVEKIKQKYRRYAHEKATVRLNKQMTKLESLEWKQKIKSGYVEGEASSFSTKKEKSLQALSKKIEVARGLKDKLDDKVKTRRRRLDWVENRVISLKERLVNAKWKDTEKFLGFVPSSTNYPEEMSKGLYALLHEGKLAASTEKLLQREMGIDLRTLDGEEGGSKKIKKFLNKGKRQILSFIRSQKRKGF